MILYDRESSINWFGKGELTPEQMKEDPTLAPMWSEEAIDNSIVLLDDGAGVVYYWRWLNALLPMYDVVATGDDEVDFVALLEAKDKPKIELSATETIEALAELGSIASTLTEAQIDLADLVSVLVGGQMEIADTISTLTESQIELANMIASLSEKSDTNGSLAEGDENAGSVYQDDQIL